MHLDGLRNRLLVAHALEEPGIPCVLYRAEERAEENPLEWNGATAKNKQVILGNKGRRRTGHCERTAFAYNQPMQEEAMQEEPPNSQPRRAQVSLPAAQDSKSPWRCSRRHTLNLVCSARE